MLAQHNIYSRVLLTKSAFGLRGQKATAELRRASRQKNKLLALYRDYISLVKRCIQITSPSMLRKSTPNDNNNARQHWSRSYLRAAIQTNKHKANYSSLLP